MYVFLSIFGEESGGAVREEDILLAEELMGSAMQRTRKMLAWKSILKSILKVFFINYFFLTLT